VTVTADRTGERELQKIPMAVSVLSEGQSTQREAHTVGDLAGLAPGVTVGQNTGFSQLTMEPGRHVQMRPFLTPITAACVRSRASSLDRIFLTWPFTASSVIESVVAISLFD
jgi:hypothetical protein